MEKTEMMKRFEEETDKQSAIPKFMCGGQALKRKSYPKLGPYDYNMEYIAWLEAKASTYDRLMSGGKKTPKDIVNFFGTPGVITDDGDLLIFDNKPIVNIGFNEQTGEPYDVITGANQIAYIDGKFESSEYDGGIVLPDGWEEANREKTLDYNLEQLGLK